MKDQENRISHLVANAVSAKTSLQIQKEIMTSQASNTANSTYREGNEDGFITVGKNNKPKVPNATADDARWINMDDDTADDRDIRANALANALQRKMDAGTGAMKSNFKMVTPTKKSSFKTKYQPYGKQHHHQSTNPYMRTQPSPVNRTPPKSLIDKKKERSEKNAATLKGIKKSYLDVSDEICASEGHFY